MESLMIKQILLWLRAKCSLFFHKMPLKEIKTCQVREYCRVVKENSRETNRMIFIACGGAAFSLRGFIEEAPSRAHERAAPCSKFIHQRGRVWPTLAATNTCMAQMQRRGDTCRHRSPPWRRGGGGRRARFRQLTPFTSAAESLCLLSLMRPRPISARQNPVRTPEPGGRPHLPSLQIQPASHSSSHPYLTCQGKQSALNKPIMQATAN
jgi:hypothetical protein